MYSLRLLGTEIITFKCRTNQDAVFERNANKQTFPSPRTLGPVSSTGTSKLVCCDLLSQPVPKDVRVIALLQIVIPAVAVGDG